MLCHGHRPTLVLERIGGALFNAPGDGISPLE